MTICVVDGRGGGLGSRIVSRLLSTAWKGHAVMGLGLNPASAEAMKRAGAASIETAPRIIHRRLNDADLIAGSLSLLMPGCMSVEVTPVFAKALLESTARKMLLPINQRKIEVIGAEGRTLETLIDHAVGRIASLLRSSS